MTLFGCTNRKKINHGSRYCCPPFFSNLSFNFNENIVKIYPMFLNKEYALVFAILIIGYFGFKKEDYPKSFSFQNKNFEYKRDANYARHTSAVFTIDGQHYIRSKQFFNIIDITNQIEQVSRLIQDDDTNIIDFYLKYYFEQNKTMLNNFVNHGHLGFAFTTNDKTVYSNIIEIGDKEHMVEYIILYENATPKKPDDALEILSEFVGLHTQLNNRRRKLTSWIKK